MTDEDEEVVLNVDDADLPGLEEVTTEHPGGGDAVSTEAECNGCDTTASLSELPDGDHDFEFAELADDSADTHITVVHLCSVCGTLSATIITSEDNVPKIREAMGYE
jgi:hypothetical protein